MDYVGQYCMRFTCLRVLIYQGLPLALALLFPSANYVALCGFLYLVPMLLVCFDPPPECHCHSRSFKSRRRLIIIPSQLVVGMRFT